ncbi:type II toxin-antitoxin system HipA family toxin [Tamilnaduibacter salinus]|uniref:type II toxin-antitoxin system HipA family toxin n=1 Tax=Tamilnaduibacter salinus TaxID=1484056 RepID=UPI001D1763B5|nr:type II toxin-antitoxin system HipA family toxin [Tamilnaduibacter salinus]
MTAPGKRQEQVEALSIRLHGHQVGILAHYAGGKNILTFDPQFSALPGNRQPTFSLTQHVRQGYFSAPLMTSQKLPPVLSNLLPEGALRSWMAQSLKTHADNEFPLLALSGDNLPGAIVAEPLPAGRIPDWALNARERINPVPVAVQSAAAGFSLAGVQMKFSAQRDDGRMTIQPESGTDDWIIKTPSTVHRHVPANEYSAMRLAEAIGVEIPAIEQIPLTALSGLPDIQLPDETTAYAIKRFDRAGRTRIHTEDFAQVFEVFAHEKYGHYNYEQIGAALYRYGSQGLADIQQLARRLLANILLANGDAHLKNWTIIYPDGMNARLAPAYDIVSTLPYVAGESESALNMAKNKHWYTTDLTHFQRWADRIGVPWPAIRGPHPGSAGSGP